MANGDDLPVFFTATSLEKEAWNDHQYLRHMGDGLTHIWDVVKPENAPKSNKWGAIFAAALTVMAVVIAALGGVPR
jgi:hypothetical protein